MVNKRETRHFQTESIYIPPKEFFLLFYFPFSLVGAIRPRFTIVIDGQHFLRWGIERLSPLRFPGFTSRRNDGLYDFVNFPIVPCPSHSVSHKNHAALARERILSFDKRTYSSLCHTFGIKFTGTWQVFVKFRTSFRDPGRLNTLN